MMAATTAGRTSAHVRALAFVACTALTATGYAQAHGDRVRAISSDEQGSDPAKLTVAGDYLYFTADDGIHGRELWMLDRNETASLVYDLVAGPADGVSDQLHNAGGTLYFFSLDGRLWATEGETLTTRRVHGGMLEPAATAALNDTFIFAAADSTHGLELWASRGTPESTHRIREGIPGAPDSLSRSSSDLVAFDGHVYFAMHDDEIGPTVWFTDGTAQGTAPLRDPSGVPVPAAKGMRFAGVVTEQGLYLLAGGNRTTLWLKKRGETTARRLKPGYEGSSMAFGQLGRAGNLPVFQRETAAFGKELWGIVRNGTATGLIADLYPGPFPSGPYEQHPLGAYSIFLADHPDYGIELWRTDGTPAGTELVKDLVEGAQSSDPYQLTPVGDGLFFSCENYDVGEELWWTDGTPGGTRLVRDINPEGDAEPYDLAAFNGNVYFGATHAAYGRELWTSDGTAAGTRQVARIKPATQVVRSSHPRHLTAYRGALYFTATGKSGAREVWVAHGPHAEPAVAVNESIPEGHAVTGLQIRRDTIVVETSRSDATTAHWQWDPTESTPALLPAPSGVEAPAGRPFPMEAVRSGGELDAVPAEGQWAWAGEHCVFAAYSPHTGTELWILRKGARKASLLRDIIRGPASSTPDAFRSNGQHVFFRAEEINKGCELWITDGTEQGTRMLADFRESPLGAMPRQLTLAPNGTLFYVATGVSGGNLLVVAEPPHYDPRTPFYGEWQETVLNPQHLTPVGDALYFVSDHPRYGVELWVTRATPDLVPDNAAANIALVQDILSNGVYDEKAGQWIPGTNAAKERLQRSPPDTAR